ncbi:hypothetical protein GQ54DRAFT_298248 [Martensiomyces pterosporus]|nr:hypothetical protein GQ54DRAFT_298248 [Martensiomyces pterosporus]
MHEPIFTYCREILPPSIVGRAVSLSFTEAGKANLALARGNLLELYEVELVERRARGSDDREVPADEYTHRNANADEFDLPMIRGDAKSGGAGDELHGNKQPQLHLLGQWSLHGAIMDMQGVRCGTKGRKGVDSLLISFPEAKMSLVSFEPSTQSIVTESIHYYEQEALMQKSFNDSQSCDLRVDPAGRCAIMRIYEDQLAVLPLIAPDEPSTQGSAKPYMDSFVVNLRTPEINVRNVRDYVFLNGYLEPTLALLHEQETTWPGLVESRRDTCVVSVLSLDLSRRTMPVIQTASGLPYDCQVIIPVPQPIGGVLVFASSSIAHITNGSISCLSVLNKAAVHGIGASMREYIDSTNEALGLVLSPRDCAPVFISQNTLALWTQLGQTFLLKLDGEGRRVERIVAKQFSGTDPRSEEQTPGTNTWDDLCIIPSCVAELRLSYDDAGGGQRGSSCFFVGGSSGRSLLLGVEYKGSAKKINTKRAGGTAGRPPAQTQQQDTDASMASQSDDTDIDALLYGDASMAPRTLSLGNIDTPGTTTDSMDASEGAGAEVWSDSDSWAAHFRFTVYDEILGTGPITDMEVGASAAARAKVFGDEGLELVTCTGNEWRGCLRVQQRQVRPEVIASFDLPGAPARRVWTVRCRKEYNIGGVMQAADDVPLTDLADTFMVVSRDASTAVFAAGDELQEMERTGFFTRGATLEVGEILGNTRIIQVHADGMLVLSASGRETQAFTFDHGQRVVSAEIADPYVLLRTSLDDYMLFEADAETRKLNAVAIPSVFDPSKVVSTAFFEDVHRVLTTTKEWIDHNPDALEEQTSGAMEGNALDADLDYLYADNSGLGKRKQPHNSQPSSSAKRSSRRKHADAYDDLYNEDEEDPKPSSSLGAGDEDGDEIITHGAVAGHLLHRPESKPQWNAGDEQDSEASNTEGIRNENPLYMLIARTNGDLCIYRLPQFDEVWRTTRFDYLSDVLTAAVTPVPGKPNGGDAASDSDSDNGSDEGSSKDGAAPKDGINGAPRQGAASSGSIPGASDAAIPGTSAHSRRLDQFTLVQLGGADLQSTFFVVLSTAGEVVVYRAFEHCAVENLVHIRQSKEAPADLQSMIAYEYESQLALRFVRVPHDVLAYDPGYEAKVRSAQAKQARAFESWDKRNKERLADLAEAEKLAREKAKAKQRREESDAVADWGDSDSETPGSDSGDGNAGAGSEHTDNGNSIDGRSDLGGKGAGASLPDAQAEDAYMPADSAVDVFAGSYETEGQSGEQGSTAADAKRRSEDEGGGVGGLAPLVPVRKFTVLDNIGGYSALFVSGLRPMIVLVGTKKYARVHPVRLPVKLPQQLLPQDAPKEFDPVANGLLTPCRPVVGLARFHSSQCPHGFVALTQAGTLVIGSLPASAQAARGGVEFDAPWPVRCIPVGTAHAGVSTLGGVAFHPQSGSYAVASTTISQFYIKEPDPEIAAKVTEEELRKAAATDGNETGSDGDNQIQAQALMAGLTPDQLDPQQSLIPEHQRPNIHTTSAPPLAPRFHLDLLSPATWETVDTYSFEQNEHIVAMQTLELESRQTAGGRKPFLCVATGFILGEDVSSRGKIYIFDIVEVVPLPGRPQTNRKLKLLYQEEIRGTISALGEMRGHVVVSVGSKIFVRSFEDNEKLVSVAFLDCQSWVKSLVGLKSFLLIGDLVNSIWFAGFQEEGPTKVQILGRDYYNKLAVEQADFLIRGSQLLFLVADTYGQLHFFSYAPHDAHSFKGQKLLRRGEYNLRSRVASIKRLVTHASPSLPDESQHQHQQVCLVATASGAIQAISMVPERTFKRMHRMNTQLVHGVPPLAGLNPREYRSVPLHLRQYHSPKRTVLDADLLVPLFAHGSVLRQREIAQRVGTTADRVMRDIIGVEQSFAFL